MNTATTPKIELYNSVIETATRSLLILEELRPLTLSLDDLRAAELFVVFGGDIGAPFTIHNLLPGRMQAHGFRGPLVKKGLDLLKTIDLIEVEGDDIRYRSRGKPVVVHHLGTSKYLYRMRRNAAWMASRIAEIGLDPFRDEMDARIAELLPQSMEMPEAMRERFTQLQTNYELDIDRMHGLNEAAVVMSFAAPKAMMQMFDDTAEAALKEVASVRSNLKGLASVMAEMTD